MKILSTLFAFFLTAPFYGQSTKSLPQAGDTYYRCTHIEKSETFLVNPTDIGYWDFGFLRSYYTIKENFEKASTGKFSKSFPGSTLVWKKANGTEEYLYTKDGGLYSLGMAMEVPYKKSRWEILRYEPAKKIMQAGTKKGQQWTQKYTMVVKIARADVTVASNFIPAQYDSLLLEIEYSENGEYTDDGDLSYGQNTTAVSRIEYNMSQFLRTKSKKGNGKWQNYEKFNGNTLPPALSSMLRFQKYSRVEFYSPDYAGPMVAYEVINNGIPTVEYQNRDIAANVMHLTHDDNGIVAYPNPTFGPVVIDLFNYPYDQYNFEVYNIVGKRIFSKSFSPKDGRQLKVDLSQLKRGTYMYSVFDGTGRKIVTKRVSLISI